MHPLSNDFNYISCKHFLSRKWANNYHRLLSIHLHTIALLLLLLLLYLPPLHTVLNVEISIEPIIYFHPFPMSYFLCVYMWIYYVNIYMSDEWSEISHICSFLSVYFHFPHYPFTSMLEHNPNVIFSFFAFRCYWYFRSNRRHVRDVDREIHKHPLFAKLIRCRHNRRCENFFFFFLLPLSSRFCVLPQSAFSWSNDDFIDSCNIVFA